MKKKRLRLKYKNLLLLLAFVMFIVLIIMSVINITKWYFDSKKTKNETKNIIENIKITEVKDDDNTEIISSENKEEDDPYWDYIKMDLMTVDFKSITNLNHDVKGFLKVNGTNINYPFVQTNNNEYYLTHSLDKSYNKAGWVFLDYRNKFKDRNTILYAHARVDKTMFGSLKNILNKTWQKNTNNHVVWMSTENENTLWQVFSIYKIKTTTDYLSISFKNDDEFLSFAQKLKERSIYNFNSDINSNDKILTLSTCGSKDERIVLHAKLIKIQKSS